MRVASAFPSNVARYYCPAGSAGSHVLFAGGNGGSGAVATVDVYDVAAQAWLINPPALSVARLRACVVGDGGLIIIAGGYTDSRYLIRCAGSRNAELAQRHRSKCRHRLLEHRHRADNGGIADLSRQRQHALCCNERRLCIYWWRVRVSFALFYQTLTPQRLWRQRQRGEQRRPILCLELKLGHRTASRHRSPQSRLRCSG